ncbi:hypothetical protein DAPPUDRAFT_330867 [Daphnia pulex]|nr:hypothetical protein DAPPUDRAFT_330867 [Daphnia pulex]|eukprot:EFX67596.1 hypothetical protein DAPPUDRAFT_330867 [Daphnia pulex]
MESLPQSHRHEKTIITKNLVFSSEQESNLSSYVKRASDIYHGITTTESQT